VLVQESFTSFGVDVGNMFGTGEAAIGLIVSGLFHVRDELLSVLPGLVSLPVKIW
jgi:hypothetical protein